MATLASDWLRHFLLLLWNHWREFNKTWQKSRYQRPLPSCVFRADRKNKMAARPLIGWDIFDFSPETNEVNSTKLDRNQISMSYTKFLFSGHSEKLDDRLGLWFAETFSTSSPETTKRNSTKLDRKQESNVLYPVCVFRADWKKMAARPLIGWDICLFFLWNSWTEFNKTRQEARFQRPLLSCFGADRKNKMAALASDWLRHFRLLPWNN